MVVQAPPEREVDVEAPTARTAAWVQVVGSSQRAAFDAVGVHPSHTVAVGVAGPQTTLVVHREPRSAAVVGLKRAPPREAGRRRDLHRGGGADAAGHGRARPATAVCAGAPGLEVQTGNRAKTDLARREAEGRAQPRRRGTQVLVDAERHERRGTRTPRRALRRMGIRVTGSSAGLDAVSPTVNARVRERRQRCVGSADFVRWSRGPLRAARPRRGRDVHHHTSHRWMQRDPRASP